jgi:hypothetical protein
MRRLRLANRAPAIVLAMLALGVAATGGALAAGGGSNTITACVKKHGGSLYQAKKCKKHDKTLSWNKQGLTGPQGPAGTAGANGTNGTNGTDGAVAGYSATHGASIDITARSSFFTIVSKQLPAGHYIVDGSVLLAAKDTAPSPQTSSDTCELTDGPSSSQQATWISPEAVLALSHAAQGTVPMEMALNTTSTTTVSLECLDDLPSPPGTYETDALNAVITAVQTSSNS